MKDKLIILDMDNTILQSKIDFPKMSREVSKIMLAHGLERYSHESVATGMVKFAQSADYDEIVAEEIWQKVTEIEAEGLDQAVLEPGAIAALEYLGQYAELAVLSNNTDSAIGDNLNRLGIAPYLTFVAGRNSVPNLKPSPDGMLFVKSQYPSISLANTLTVGDAMIDAQAAEAAGIGFVAYNRSRMEDWPKWNITPLIQLTQWDRAACERIRELWQ